jgi:hypothetical protein
MMDAVNSRQLKVESFAKAAEPTANQGTFGAERFLLCIFDPRL